MDHSDFPDSQSWRWLLRDKYRVSESEIFVRTSGKFLPENFPDIAAQLHKDIARLQSGEPIQYVIGWVPFLGCEIDLSLKPLIPRPETEFWVGQVIEETREQETGEQETREQETGDKGQKMGAFHVLDLCCGSGCIGIALLKHLPNVRVDFADIQADAVRQTKINLVKNKVAAERSQIFQSDLFAAVPKTRYNLIVCNPPYVDPFGEYSADLQFEPSQSLFAQNNGLALIEQIILESKNHLKWGGKLILEFGKGQAEAIQRMAEATAYTKDQVRQDQYGVERWVELIN